MSKSIFHLATFVLCALTCYQDSQLVKGDKLPIKNNFWSRFVFLTNVDLYLQTIYHFIAFLLSISGIRRNAVFDYFARTIIGPLGVAVAVLYWGLTLMDPNSVNDEMGKMLLSMPWYNHRLHTLPSIAAHLDLYFWNHQTFKNCKVTKGLGVFAAVYCFIVHYVYYISGSWAYPILGELSPPFRIAFIGASMLTIYMKVLFHLAAFGLYAWTCYEDYFLVSGELLPIPNQFFSKFVWLTLIDLYSQLLYHFVGIILSLFFDKKRHPIYDYVARAIIGPIGVSVTVLFWALYLADPGTLAKDEMGRKILAMKWFNHGLHTLPIITTHLDLFFWDHSRFSKSAILKGIGIFVTLYLIDIHYVYYSAGFWAYPILGQLALPFRLLFIVVCMLVVYSSYLWLSLVNSFINKDKKKVHTKKN